MSNREFILQKIQLQKVRNSFKSMTGVKVLCLYENKCIPSLSEIQNSLISLDYYSPEKIPRDKISTSSDDNTVCKWIADCACLQNGKIFYLLFNNLWSKIQIIDEFMAVRELWNRIGIYNGLILVDEPLEKMFEFCCDSRDEYNFLFDEYDLRVLKLN